MANKILTPEQITALAIMQVQNNTVLGRYVDYDFESDFGKAIRIGQGLDIRRPYLGVVQEDDMAYSAANLSPVAETSVKMVISKSLTSTFNVTDIEAALMLPLEDFGKRVAKPTTAMMASKYDSDLHNILVNAKVGGKWTPTNPSGTGTLTSSGVYRGVAGWAIGDYGVALTKDVILDAKAILENAGCPDDGEIYGILTPKHNAQLSNAQLGLFNAQKAISEIYMKGRVGEFAGIEFATSQTCATHTNGTATTIVVTSDSSNTTSSGWADTGTLKINALSGKTIKAGDVFEAKNGGTNNAYFVNALSKQNTDIVSQFTVIKDVADGGTSVEVYPAPITGGQYQNTSASIASTTMTLKGAASASGQESIIFHKKAFCAAFADLPTDKDGHFERDEDLVKFALRYTRKFDAINAAPGSTVPGWITRLDAIYGARVVRGEWIVRVRGGYAA